jgi:hypothetical protein
MSVCCLLDQGPAANLVRPVKIRSWNSLVRLGLVQLISADTPVSPTAVPETLLLDLERLFRLQNEFGRIIVLAACLLVLQQVSRPSEGERQALAMPTHDCGSKFVRCVST